MEKQNKNKKISEQRQAYEVGYFAHLNKNETMDQYEEEIIKGEFSVQQVKVIKIIEVDKITYVGLQNCFLDDYQPYDKIGGHDIKEEARKINPSMYDSIDKKESWIDLTEEEKKFYKENSITKVIKVICPKRKEQGYNDYYFYVNTEGYSYARYVGLSKEHYDFLINQKIKEEERINQEIEDLKTKAKEKEERLKGLGQELTKSQKIDLGTKEIARLIREQLKKEFPTCTFSVTKESYSMGSSIHIHLMKSYFNLIKKYEDISETALIKKESNSYTRESIKQTQKEGHHQLNQYGFREAYDPNQWNNGVFLTEKGYKLFKRVCDIINYYNFDESDSQTDYYSVNFSPFINIGKWDKTYTYEHELEESLK